MGQARVSTQGMAGAAGSVPCLERPRPAPASVCISGILSPLCLDTQIVWALTFDVETQAQQVQNTRQVQDMVTSLDSLDPASAKVVINTRYMFGLYAGVVVCSMWFSSCQLTFPRLTGTDSE